MAAPPFRRVLVANRGEIAVRLCRGLRELGVQAVAIHSDPDAAAPHVTAADLAVPLGGETAAESYLDIEKVIEAAHRSHAEAVHPGYGFLSENPLFARAVEEEGLVFIGPTPRAMEVLGSKRAARAAAEKAGVPVVPGVEGDASDDELRAAAGRLGFPIMIKASAGGGGKGMRRVEGPEDFVEALQAARREAMAAFGDGTMIVEKVVQPARHVEIQILGDHHGEVVSLHERECSVQRRHQKVLEEAPSPAVDGALRRRMGEAAVALAKSLGYRNAGTVEFLLGPDGSFYFLEVNTRLQVEHPVTELVTGLDLVHLQVAVAAGAKLADLLAGHDTAPRGHAIEARIYAEVPEQGFLPAAGTLRRVREPEGPGIRVDSGVHDGSEVSVHYDPMLAKLIVHAPSRAAACARLALALRESVYLGIPTNVDFLTRVVDDPDFRSGDLRIDFLDHKHEVVHGHDRQPPDEAYVAAALCAVLGGTGRENGAPRGAAAPVADAWGDLDGFRAWGGRS